MYFRPDLTRIFPIFASSHVRKKIFLSVSGKLKKISRKQLSQIGIYYSSDPMEYVH